MKTEYETLKDRITKAQLAVYDANGGSASDDELSAAALAALGLDDLDAAAKRLAAKVEEISFRELNYCWGEGDEVVPSAHEMIAALLATGGSGTIRP